MSDEKKSARALSPRKRVIDYVRWHEAAYMAPAPPEEVREQLSRRNGLDTAAIDDLMRDMQLDNTIYFVERGECFGWALVDLSQCSRGEVMRRAIRAAREVWFCEEPGARQCAGMLHALIVRVGGKSEVNPFYMDQHGQAFDADDPEQQGRSDIPDDEIARQS